MPFTGRRTLLAAGAAALLAPAAALAQSGRPPRIAWAPIAPGAENRTRAREALAAEGLEEGRNLALTFLDFRRLSARAVVEANARQLVDSRPDAIVIEGPYPEVFVLQRLTRRIPIILVAYPADPSKVGLVESLRRPGANITGTSVHFQELVSKQLGLLKEIRPSITRIGRLQTREALEEDKADEIGHGRFAAVMDEEARTAAARLGVRLKEIVVSRRASTAGIATAVRESGVQGLVIETNLTNELFEYLRTTPIPACIYFFASVRAGALIGVSFDIDECRRQSAAILARILRGEDPGSLPVYQATKYGFAVNLKTARANGIDIPKSILVAADEIFE